MIYESFRSSFPKTLWLQQRTRPKLDLLLHLVLLIPKNNRVHIIVALGCLLISETGPAIANPATPPATIPIEFSTKDGPRSRAFGS
ncbi:hypothetical protein ACHAWO_001769 [Cyclotella atomus]|uniref:Uncharacterized protein n=1 Tax=Cyclotella atomus TaxID=382360 RepID=A0ABD3PH63_9STRA